MSGAPSSRAPGVAPGVPGEEIPDPSPSAQPGQRQGPSGVVEEEQQIPSSSTPADQQPSSTESSECQ
jgi:hypothetical protein